MKLNEIKRTITGTNNMHCLVSLEYTNNCMWFVDNTKGICTKVKTQKELNNILQNNNF